MIDPGQPIMFDSDLPPGRGAGFWQMDPGRSDDSLSSNGGATSKVAKFFIFVLVFGGMGLGFADMLLR